MSKNIQRRAFISLLGAYAATAAVPLALGALSGCASVRKVDDVLPKPPSPMPSFKTEPPQADVAIEASAKGRLSGITDPFAECERRWATFDVSHWTCPPRNYGGAPYAMIKLSYTEDGKGYGMASSVPLDTPQSEIDQCKQDLAWWLLYRDEVRRLEREAA